MQPSTRGTTRRWIGLMPSTSMASISSRILRAPRSAQIAEPPAPAISSAVTMGLASRMTDSTLAAPVNDCAPSWRVRLPSCRAMTAPNGMLTSAVGRIVTLAMNHACCTNSLAWNGRRGKVRTTSRPSANRLPLCRSAPTPGLAIGPAARQHRGPALAADRECVQATYVVAGAGVRRGEGPGRRGDAVLPAPRTRRAGGAARGAVGRAELDRDRRQGRQLLAGRLLLGELVGVLLLRHADRALPLRVEELPDDRLLAGEQHLPRPEHRQVPVVEQPDVVGHRAGGVDVVG